MKVLLINPTYPERPRRSFFPMGLAYIAGALRKAGHQIQIADTDADMLQEKELREIVGDSDIDVVGTGGLVTALAHIRWIVDIVKETKPHLPVMVGGGLVSSMPDYLFSQTKADIGVIKEGEISSVEIVDRLAQGRDLSGIQGIYYRNDKGDVIQNPERAENGELDDLAYPAWDMFKLEKYFETIENIQGKRWLPMLGTRSCPYQCTFCYHPIGIKYRTRSPKSIVDEILYFKERYHFHSVRFMDEMFALNRHWVVDYCKHYIERNVQLPWDCAARVNSADVEMYEWMKKANCVDVNFGLESGSDTMLRVMKKGTKASAAEKAIAVARDSGYEPTSSFMLGAIGETPETIQETVDFIKRNNLYVGGLFFQTPYPGTPLYDWALENKRISDHDRFISRLGNAAKLMVNLTDLPKWKLVYLKCKAEREIRSFFIKNNPAKFLSLQLDQNDKPVSLTFQCYFNKCQKTYERKFFGFFNIVVCPHCNKRYHFSTSNMIKVLGVNRTLMYCASVVKNTMSMSFGRMLFKAYASVMANFSDSFVAVYLSSTSLVRVVMESIRDKRYWESQ